METQIGQINNIFFEKKFRKHFQAVEWLIQRRVFKLFIWGISATNRQSNSYSKKKEEEEGNPIDKGNFRVESPTNDDRNIERRDKVQKQPTMKSYESFIPYPAYLKAIYTKRENQFPNFLKFLRNYM